MTIISSRRLEWAAHEYLCLRQSLSPNASVCSLVSLIGSHVVPLFALFVVAIGLWVVISPAELVRFAARWQLRTSFWVAILFHLLFGLALWSAAPHAWHAIVVQVFAVVCVVAAVLLAVGRSRIQASISWWSARLSPALPGDLSVQNRPTKGAQDVTVLSCQEVPLQV